MWPLHNASFQCDVQDVALCDGALNVVCYVSLHDAKNFIML